MIFKARPLGNCFLATLLLAGGCTASKPATHVVDFEIENGGKSLAVLARTSSFKFAPLARSPQAKTLGFLFRVETTTGTVAKVWSIPQETQGQFVAHYLLDSSVPHPLPFSMSDVLGRSEKKGCEEMDLSANANGVVVACLERVVIFDANLNKTGSIAGYCLGPAHAEHFHQRGDCKLSMDIDGRAIIAVDAESKVVRRSTRTALGDWGVVEEVPVGVALDGYDVVGVYSRSGSYCLRLVGSGVGDAPETASFACGGHKAVLRSPFARWQQLKMDPFVGDIWAPRVEAGAGDCQGSGELCFTRFNAFSGDTRELSFKLN